MVLLTGQPFALTTAEISCCTCWSVTQPAFVEGTLTPPFVAATGVSGQLTGSSGGSGFVSRVEPANVVCCWMYVFVEPEPLEYCVATSWTFGFFPFVACRSLKYWSMFAEYPAGNA